MFARRVALGVALLAVGTLALLSHCRHDGHDAPSNVILVVIDTLRADRLGCYGYPRDISPNIDAFAGEALLFEKCLSHAADTRFACASLLTGFLLHETGILDSPILREELDTLPEILRARGFATAAVISNYVLRKGLAYEQGFDVYDDTMDQREAVRNWPERIAARTTDRAIELLEDHRGKSLFMWIHYQDPHGPYAPPKAFTDRFRDPASPPRMLEPSGSMSGRGGIPKYQMLGEHRAFDLYRARYDGEIRYVDEEFKRLIDALKRLSTYDDTLIILTSDHGEGMGEHDYYFAHGEYLYQHQLHVPLIVRWGDRLQGRREPFVQHVDILPTVLDILGIQTQSRLRGIDLRIDTEREILAEMQSRLAPEDRKHALVRDGKKLIHTPSTNRLEIYDLLSDPHETSDLASDPAYSGHLRILKTRMSGLRSEDRPGLDKQYVQPTLTEEQQARLRSLGYLD